MFLAEAGETATDAALRETEEEVGIRIQKDDVQHVGCIEFQVP